MDGVKSAPDVKEYELTDVVGKAGIEKVMEEYLQGTKGYETVFVDRMGREVEVLDHVDATAGNDVYLTIDSKLQADAYNILEKFVAGIPVSYTHLDVYKRQTAGCSIFWKSRCRKHCTTGR